METGDRTEIEQLRAQLAAQDEELARLRRAVDGPTPTRREVLRSAGLVAGGLAAAAAVAGAASARPAVAVEGHNVRLRGTGGYLWLKGQKQGNINGEVTQKGRENSIEVEYFQSKIVSPRDAASGLPTGKRQHQPLVIRKPVDKSTPLLLSALVSNENLSEATFKFYKTNATTGSEILFFSVKLENASIASHNTYNPQANDAGGSAVPAMEELSFTYQKITWTNEQFQTVAQDDWEEVQ